MHRYKLIDGTFSAPDAAQVLLTLVKSKMDFHERERVSNQERFGSDVAHSARRSSELRQLHETLRELCQSAAASGQSLQVNGWLEITLGPAQTS